jgi:hypothetical protein
MFRFVSLVIFVVALIESTNISFARLILEKFVSRLKYTKYEKQKMSVTSSLLTSPITDIGTYMSLRVGGELDLEQAGCNVSTDPLSNEQSHEKSDDQIASDIETDHRDIATNSSLQVVPIDKVTLDREAPSSDKYSKFV